MQSPASGEGYLRQPKRTGSREEVIARCREAILNKKYETKTIEEKLTERHEKAVWDNNYIASFYPVWLVTGPQMPAFYLDDRMRNYIGKYGQTKSD
ncbi:hypothetical protein ACSFCW_07665 [Yokenella regensburgei]|uniref:hypothetical protein n=1 Tax=Yokenella regensburgei TaxID=158877 RepID=UPI003ED9A5D8